jgi:hypothetical protein
MFKKTTLFFLFLLISCKQRIEIPQDSYITTRFTVFDEKISPQLDVCPCDTIKNFIENNGDDCIFRLEEYTFEVEYKMILSEEGHMLRLEEHSVTKDIDYKKFGIIKNQTDPTKLNGFDFFIRFSSSKKQIIDGNDTLEIEKIFPKEKLIFVENKNTNKGRRNIYQYK